VIMGDYVGEQAVWESRSIAPGTPLRRPTPLFTKVDESLGETGPAWAPIER
jgi:methionyl-tRNA synthetase